MTIKLQQRHIVFMAMLAVLFILLFFNAFFYEVLRYSRGEILAGDVWRIFTSHFVHLNVQHGLLNILALIIIVFALGDILTLKQWLFASLGLCLFTSLGLLVFSQHVVSYVGLSGVLHGLFALLLSILTIKESKLYALLLLGLVIKIAREQLPNFDIYHMKELIGGAVIVDGHLYGTVTGVVFALVMMGLEKYKPKLKPSNSL